MPPPDEPYYLISDAAKMVKAHPQTLRRYEELGLVKPARLSGRRMYSLRDIERLRKIIYLTEGLGVNLAGVEIILNLSDQLEKLQERVAQMEKELKTLKAQQSSQ
ncbi:MAG: MerR family transcriptional regulator [Chloroflexi bacterium]|nr:MAG: MerR family transcriptional regulator [Chloroflexota bacterium]HDN80786.1 MerR family transcriptional regulator [Chloroflexota bacterium]